MAQFKNLKMSFFIKIFALVFTTFLFSNNCSAQSFAKKIIGKWKIVKFEAVPSGQKLDSLLVKKSLNNTITFNQDGTFSTAQLLNAEYKILGTGNYKISEDGKYLYQDELEVNILTFRDKDFAIQVKDVLIMHLSKMIDFTLPKENLKVNISKTITDVNFSPIPNATLQLQNDKLVFKTNSIGFFKVAAFLKDSISISCVGYKAKVFSINDLVNSDEIILEEDRKVLKEVVVSNVKKESIVLNDFSNCVKNYFATNGNKNFIQIAQKINTTITNYFLKSISICKMKGKSVFRLRIYENDSLKSLPGKDLTDTTIFVSTRKGQININLEKYKIHIKENSFFVAIEFMFGEDNLQTSTRKVNGVKEIINQYKPLISVRLRKI